MLDRVLRHLEALVSFDTRNPPRDISTGGIFDYLRAQLPDFRCTVTDHGEGAVSLLAVRGNPTRVFNVHLDTVPNAAGWTRPTASPVGRRTAARSAWARATSRAPPRAWWPRRMRPRATPRSSSAATRKPTTRVASKRSSPATTASSKRSSPSPRSAKRCSRIAASVRCCCASRARRGMPRARTRCTPARCTTRCAGAAARWTYVESQSHQRFGGLTGLRFNVGRVEGGIKANVIAPSAEVRFGFRPLPSMAFEHLHDALRPPRRTGRARCATRKPSAVRRCRRAMSPRPKRAASKRATSPTNSACPSATRSISGPKPRCSRARA